MTMKDAHGHGSDSGNPSTIKSGGLRGVGIAGGFSGKPLAPRQPTSEAMRTVADLRSRMSSAEPGHSSALMQGIKNLLGG